MAAGTQCCDPVLHCQALSEAAACHLLTCMPLSDRTPHKLPPVEPWAVTMSITLTPTQLNPNPQVTSNSATALQLSELRLASNHLGDWGAAPLLEALASGCCPLRWLDLSGCGLTEQCAPGLLAALESSRQLQVLKLGWSSLGLRGAKALAAGLQANSSLRELHLPWSGIGDCGGWGGGCACGHYTSGHYTVRLKTASCTNVELD